MVKSVVRGECEECRECGIRRVCGRGGCGGESAGVSCERAAEAVEEVGAEHWRRGSKGGMGGESELVGGVGGLGGARGYLRPGEYQ